MFVAILLRFAWASHLFVGIALVLVLEEQKANLTQTLQQVMKDSVRLVVFTQEMECSLCKESRELAQEVAALLPDKIQVEVYDFVKDDAKVKEYGVDKVPAIAVVGAKDYGIRYYGIPYGYEFSSFIETIANVSKGVTNLSEDTKSKLQTLDKPAHIQVFVTLTCPYCAIAGSLAHKFAIESSMVKSDIVDVNEFPHLAQKYSIMGVPKIVINERTEIVGAVPEAQFVAHVLQATKPPSIYM